MWDKIERIFKNLSWYLHIFIGIILSLIVGLSGQWGLMTLFIFSMILTYFIQIGLIKLFQWLLRKKDTEDIPEDIVGMYKMVIEKYWRK